MRELRTMPWVAVVVSAQFLVMLDSSILNAALPSIAAGMDVSTTGSAWILNAYFLTFGGFLLVAGRAADVFGRRRMFLFGTALLALGSVAGASAPAEGVLIAARLVQGLGAAALSPAAMSIILAHTTGRPRAAAMSAWGAASALAGATGVSVGGVLTAAFGWQVVFLVSAGVAGVVWLVAARMLPADGARRRRSFDAAGAVAVTVAATGAVWAVLTASESGVSPQVLMGAALAVAGLAAFVARERRAVDPVLPLELLRDLRTAGGLVVNLLGGAARIGCFFMVAMLLQQAFRFDAGIAGLAMLPTSVAGFLVTVLALPRLLGRFGAERVLVLGLVLVAVAHGMLAAAPSSPTYVLHVLPALLLAAAGVAMSFTPTTLVIASGIPSERSGIASGLASSSAQLGGAIGIAVFTAVNTVVQAASVSDGAAPLEAVQAGLSAAFATASMAAAAGAVLAMIVLVAPRMRRVAPWRALTPPPPIHAARTVPAHPGAGSASDRRGPAE